jgi:hypothetical protein
MIEGGAQGRAARLIAIALAAGLVGACAAPTSPPFALPTAAERSAAEAEGFEVPPVLDARDLLAPERRAGPHFEVDDTVYCDGTRYVFTIHSDFGTFHAHGDDMLRMRVREIAALAALAEMNATSEFAGAAARALGSPLVATWNLITDPVDSIIGIPKNAWEGIRRTSELAQGERGELENSAFVELIGFEAKKRLIASELGVDPYTSNKTLQRELNRFAWAAYAGGLPSIFVPFSDAPGSEQASSTDGPEAERLQSILQQYSPEDIDRLSRIELAVMGVPKPLTDDFIGHPWYSPHHEVVLVESLSGLDLARNRRAFIEVAVTAKSEADARFYQRVAELMLRYNDSVARVDKIVAFEGVVSGYTSEGKLVAPLAADYAVWSKPTAALVESFATAKPDHGEVNDRKLLLSGTVSPKARSEIEARGIEVVDRAFDRLATGAGRAEE